MNKKGALPFEIGLWIMRIIMVIIIIAGIALQIRTYVNAKVDMEAVEPTLLAQVISTSPAILYSDDSGIKHNKISVEQFNQAEGKINSELRFNKDYLAAKIMLQERDGKVIKKIFLNKDFHDVLSAQVKSLLGKTVTSTIHKRPIIIIEKGKERKGILFVEVLQPR